VPVTPKRTHKPPRRTANPMHRSDYVRFREALREWREAAGLSQRDMAKRLGKSLAWVNRSETGGRRMDALEWLAWVSACGVPIRAAVQRIH
jgi:ribosome-binding protein aMBF1 (putative translation factor)